jgi:hypothetical protein
MRSSLDDEEWIPDTDHDRHAVLAQLERLIGPSSDNEWVPETDHDRQAVFAQLDRMLEDARFRVSHHYPRFLRFVVEATVRGSTDQLKERDLGVVVFGRSADYDLDSDPIVRVKAAEIQDRIMQYYGQEEHSAELRIELPYGSYIPRFRQPSPRVARAPERTQSDAPSFRRPETRVARVPDHTQPEAPPKSPIHASGATETSPTKSERPATSKPPRIVWALVLVILGLVTVIALGVAKKYRVDAVTSFWQFGRDNPSTVMVCIRQVEPGTTTSSPGIKASPSAATEEDAVPYSDVVAAAKISSAISLAGLTPMLRPTTRTSLNDLQQGPVVIIGGFSNDWTLRLTDSLPFRFVTLGDGGAYEILDARSATAPVYSIDTSLPYSPLAQDYGIVARFLNPITERPTVIVAGLGANGTEAATSLVTSNYLLKQFLASAPRDWQKRNFEILLATHTLDGKVGPPKILAAQYW